MSGATDELHDDGTVTRDGKRYGCHCDVNTPSDIDGCVVDEAVHTDCVYATLKSGMARRSKWTCQFWRKMPEIEVTRREGLT